MPRQASREVLYGGITAAQAGAFVDAQLTAKKIPRKRIAELLGVHPTYVSDLTAGRYDLRANPERLRLLVGELGLSERELLEGLGVQPVALVSAPASRYLGRLEDLPYPPPAGRPIFIPPEFLGSHKPEDVVVLGLGDGLFGVFSTSGEHGPALQHTGKGYSVTDRPRGEVLARLVGRFHSGFSSSED